MDEPLVRRRDGGVEWWTLNRPDRRNTLSEPDVVEAFEQAATAVNRDTGVRAVVLTAAGTAFSAGGNIKDMREGAGMFAGEPADLAHGYRHGIQRITRALYHCEVPLIAAVNGPAIGAGCDLALLCDLRIASTRAVFAESFVKLGLVAGDGGSWLLSRLIGPAKAAELAFTGDPIDASTALAWGIVSRVVEPESLLSAAAELAARIAANPGHALRMTKKLQREALHQTIDSHLDLCATMQALAHQTPEHRQALHRPR
jgi:enoyl-CoA hydratase/carnithine racemase